MVPEGDVGLIPTVCIKLANAMDEGRYRKTYKLRMDPHRLQRPVPVAAGKLAAGRRKTAAAGESSCYGRRNHAAGDVHHHRLRCSSSAV